MLISMKAKWEPANNRETEKNRFFYLFGNLNAMKTIINRFSSKLNLMEPKSQPINYRKTEKYRFSYLFEIQRL